MADAAWVYDAKGYFAYNAEKAMFVADASDLDLPVDRDIWPAQIGIKGNRETKIFKLWYETDDKSTYLCEGYTLEVLND